MRIDGTYRPQIPGAETRNQAVEGGKAQTQAPAKAGPADQPVAENVQAVGGDSLASYVARAKAEPEINAQAVADARKLLEAGELDTPEAVARTAERMVDEGF